MSDSSAYAYDAAVADFASGELRWAEDDLRVVLVRDSYRPRQGIDKVRADLRSGEVTQPVRLMGRKVDDSIPGRVCLRGTPVRFTPFSAEFRYAVIFNARTNRLVAYSDLGPQKVTNGIAIVDYPDGEVCEFLVD